jgi:uncharacterized protein (DUF1684 family)
MGAIAITESPRMPQPRPPHAFIVLLLVLASSGAVWSEAYGAPAAPAAPAISAAAAPAGLDPQAESALIGEWRAQRVAALTSDSGWLTLAGLFWLKDGDNSFGRAADNALVFDNPALAGHCGTFTVSGHAVRFSAAPGAAVTHAGQAVDSLELTADTGGEPTVLASGPLRFFVIERAGNLGVRVRDLDNAHRTEFQGLSYFPVSTAWVFEARFEPYRPARRIRIVNILGMEQEYESPGAVVFVRDGREWRLDAVLEAPGARELFIMFADATSGHETYGAGRFLYAPLPSAGRTRLDFNMAYNPPCALNDFATCPLPPPQNHLKLRVEAGEKTYTGTAARHS